MTVEEVADPVIQEPTDAIIRVTSSAICGSDLHLYELLGPFLDRGDILGHEPMGVVVEVGAGVTTPLGRRPCGDPVQHLVRRVLPLPARTAVPVRDHAGAGVRQRAALFGYTKLYGQVPGGQAEYLRCRSPTTTTSPWRRPPRRALPLPQRHPPHGLAGRRVRAGARGRDARRDGPRPRRAVRVARRTAPRVSGARGRPGTGAAGRWRNVTAARRST